MAALVRRLSAVVTLLLLVVGAPIALWTFGRAVVPEHGPKLADVWTALWQKDNGTLFIAFLLIVGAIAWAVFTLCVLLEIIATIRRRPSFRIPGLKLPQSAASSLIAAILVGAVMTGGATTATAQTLPALSHSFVAAPASPGLSSPARTATPPHATRTGNSGLRAAQPHLASPRGEHAAAATAHAGPVWVVSTNRDSLWSIAAITMNDPYRYTDIVALNKNVTQPGGGHLVSADTWLELGWRLQLPADAKIPATAGQPPSETPVPAHEITVKPGDTLSQIAQDQLGDGDLYPRLAAANHISDPDEINVGQLIVIPGHMAPAVTTGAAHPHTPTTHAASTQHIAAPVHAAPKPSDTGRPAHASTRHTTSPATVTGAPTTPIPAATPPAVTTSAPAVAPPQSPTQTAASAQVDPTRVVPQEVQQPAASPTSDDTNTSILMLAGLTFLAAAASWGALVTRRRRASRRRIPGATFAPADLGAARAEKALREHADTIDPQWLDEALRTLGVTAAANHGAAIPDIVAAYLTPDHLRLVLTTPIEAVPPFHSEDGDWVLPVGSELPVDPLDQMTPLPTLASVATRGDETVLLDLERAGALSLQGDPTACREFLNHLTVELAHNSWSDGLNVSLVGWGKDLVVLNPGRLVHVESLAAATRHLQARLEETRESQTALDTDVLSGRILDIAGDAWMPDVLLIDATAAPAEQVQALQAALHDAAAAGRSTTAVVLSGASTPPGVDKILLNNAGEIRVPHLWGTDPLNAARLSNADIADLLELFAAAEPSDDDGPLLREDSLTIEAPPATPFTVDPAIPPQDEQSAVPAGTAQRAGEPNVVQIRQVPPAAAAKLASALASDPHLDADVAEWTSSSATRPQISLIGPVTVTAPGSRPPNRLARLSEVVVYLALHPTGVTADKFVTDLWAADKQPKAGTRRQLIFDVRQWMGRNPETGQTYLPNADDGLYRLTNRLIDIDLVRRLHKRAQAKAAVADPVAALHDYVTALNLVEASVQVPAGQQQPGPWLKNASGHAYSWLANPDRMEDQRIPAWIVDMTHEASELALSMLDLDTARLAGDIGHLVDENSDIPLCDLLLVAQSAGNAETAKRLAFDILKVNEAEDPEDCSPRTCRILNKAFPFGLEAVSS